MASTVLYSLTVEHGRTGMLFDTPASFAEQFRLLLADRTARAKLARAAYEYVRDRRQLKDHVHKRYDWYLSLLDRRAELTAALTARVPELGAS